MLLYAYIPDQDTSTEIQHQKTQISLPDDQIMIQNKAL